MKTLKISLPFNSNSEENLKLIYEAMDIADSTWDNDIIAVEIESIYGGFGETLWCGDTALTGRQWEISTVQKFIELINNDGLKFEIMFNNIYIDESHLGDKYCNELLNVLDNGKGNSVILNSEILWMYIHKTHPNLNIISSIVKGNTSDKVYEALGRNYSKVESHLTIDDYDKIQSLESKYSNRVELYIGSRCMLCDDYDKHMRIMSNAILTNDYTDCDCYECIMNKLSDNDKQELQNSKRDLYKVGIKKLLVIGIEHIKISGLGLEKNELHQIIDYVHDIATEVNYLEDEYL